MYYILDKKKSFQRRQILFKKKQTLIRLHIEYWNVILGLVGIKKSDKKKKKRITDTVTRETGEKRVNYFARKKNGSSSNRNFRND